MGTGQPVARGMVRAGFIRGACLFFLAPLAGRAEKFSDVSRQEP
jgi:hypothetical protein